MIPHEAVDEPMNRFEAAASDITGTSWLDDLAKASLAAVRVKFTPEDKGAAS